MIFHDNSHKFLYELTQRIINRAGVMPSGLPWNHFPVSPEAQAALVSSFRSLCKLSFGPRGGDDGWGFGVTFSSSCAQTRINELTYGAMMRWMYAIIDHLPNIWRLKYFPKFKFHLNHFLILHFTVFFSLQKIQCIHIHVLNIRICKIIW